MDTDRMACANPANDQRIVPPGRSPRLWESVLVRTRRGAHHAEGGAQGGAQ